MKFKITLKQNGIHSLKRGLESLQKYEVSESSDKFLLKEAIMFIHHGIELLLKEILVQKGSEYLIYADISDSTIKKIIQAKKENKKVFDLDSPPKTASYLDAIKRIKAFIDDIEFSEFLESKLKKLNAFRNNIEHYGIDSKFFEIENLLISLKQPLLDLLKKGIPNLEKDLELEWIILNEEILVKASKLRNPGAIKRAIIEDKAAEIEYAKDYQEYKELEPQSKVSKEYYETYWQTGDAVLKALIDGSVRLLKEIPYLEKTHIIIYHQNKKYEVKIDEKSLEKFTGRSIEEIRSNWQENFSDRFVYNKIGRSDFFENFGSIKNFIE